MIEKRKVKALSSVEIIKKELKRENKQATPFVISKFY